ncbi:succinate-semialdehyde dehydrogenase/glutarate-semialdehyde dehydrogenase [Halarchaeum solikamskense]|uniref:NAD-dependent succinate-semialdehyde dehydrogenase n=1 Tax=Halarchaeum nitratireducens TaxID=489913 RepID=UPI001B3AC513|nr:NAD-dependent succinate-semialdehyde dehydrogenase [Halarchaeum solikamskense]MBP2251755.1 succinate-semialdehyde dehydrogenase/glutarate-semialdehyde dehydrogenase [Halarchaeum solikamskense]
MERVNPATGEALDPIEADDETAVEEALSTAEETFASWRDAPLSEREELLANAADVLRENRDEYAELMTTEMGKPLAAARSEVEKCAWVCDYYAEHASEHLQDERIGAEPGVDSFVAYEPLGPILAVMPWNFPFWQVFRFAAPHLTSGNVGLLKHASNVPGCAAAIEDVFREAGYPDGVFQTLLVGSDAVDDVIEDERVKAVTLTGSEHAGRAVAETAGAELKKTVLELGGSDPFVVFDDADIAAAAETGARARTINSGQSCIAAKRFIVHEAVYDEFVDAFVAEMAALDVGDPTDDVDLGPQARADLMHDLHDQVERSVAAGATVELGGDPLDRDGFFYPPTVLTDVPRDSAVADEEVFGPVAPVFEVADEAGAIALANDTDLGLGGSVWTADRERGTRVAREIESGAVFVNELTKSDPRLPFGGIGDSGYGRELGEMGIHEFVNRKTIWVQDAEMPEDGPAGE